MVARRAFRDEWNVLWVVDDRAERQGASIAGVPVFGTTGAAIEKWSGQGVWFHCAIGDNEVRERIAASFEGSGFRPATLIDPTAVIADSAVVRCGSYVAPHAFVGPQADVGRYCLVNVGASIGHHSVCRDFSQICPGGRLSGHCEIGVGSFVGSNAVLGPGASLGARAALSASSFASRDIPEGAMGIGVPARVLAVPPSAS